MCRKNKYRLDTNCRNARQWGLEVILQFVWTKCIEVFLSRLIKSFVKSSCLVWSLYKKQYLKYNYTILKKYANNEILQFQDPVTGTHCHHAPVFNVILKIYLRAFWEQPKWFPLFVPTKPCVTSLYHRPYICADILLIVRS